LNRCTPESIAFNWLGAVSRNERLHKVLVEIFQRVPGRITEPARAEPHLRPDKSKPDIAYHSHSWTQARGRAARMIFQEILDVLFYDGRQLINCKRNHIQETCLTNALDVDHVCGS